jgi:hypothetical protein
MRREINFILLYVYGLIVMIMGSNKMIHVSVVCV